MPSNWVKGPDTFPKAAVHRLDVVGSSRVGCPVRGNRLRAARPATRRRECHLDARQARL